eukprot:1596916-Pleurochrysis_carterae.AAC.1
MGQTKTGGGWRKNEAYLYHKYYAVCTRVRKFLRIRRTSLDAYGVHVLQDFFLPLLVVMHNQIPGLDVANVHR